MDPAPRTWVFECKLCRARFTYRSYCWPCCAKTPPHDTFHEVTARRIYCIGSLCLGRVLGPDDRLNPRDSTSFGSWSKEDHGGDPPSVEAHPRHRRRGYGSHGHVRRRRTLPTLPYPSSSRSLRSGRRSSCLTSWDVNRRSVVCARGDQRHDGYEFRALVRTRRNRVEPRPTGRDDGSSGPS